MLKVVSVQSEPQFKDMAKSIEQVEQFLAGYDPDADQIDLIMLPEMALIGYKFDDKDDVMPYCEKFPDSVESLL